MMDNRPATQPVLFDDAWEPPPRPGRSRLVVVAAVTVIALIVASVQLLKSRARISEPDDARWVARPMAATTERSSPPTKSLYDLREPSEVLESPPGPTPRPRARAVIRPDGYLSINSSPWAALAVDGHVVGNTPQIRIRVTPGRHHLVLVRDGFQTHNAWVNVPAGGTVRLTDITLAGVDR